MEINFIGKRRLTLSFRN